MKYLGKDIVHEGNGLELDPERLAAALPHSARKNVRKAERAGFRIERRAGTRAEMSALRALWYCPDDPNFPAELGAEDVLYMAWREDRLVGGMVLVPVGSHLFLNNLLANDEGKDHQLQGYLLWHATRELAGSGYRYIDVGVSYRPNLQRFFQKWSTFHYPVLFHPPAIRPRIDFHPFERLADELPAVEEDDPRPGHFLGGAPFTLLPGRAVAEELVRERGEPCTPVSDPRDGDDGLRVLDLTRLLPVQYGAALLGASIPPQELWDRHGCFDFVKTAHLRAVLAHADLPAIEAARRVVWERYSEAFAREDVEVVAPAPLVESFEVRFVRRAVDLEALRALWSGFGVTTEIRGDVLAFPCHQNLTPADVRYVHAVYRGHLNLCSEWTPTNVRGRLATANG